MPEIASPKPRNRRERRAIAAVAGGAPVQPVAYGVADAAHAAGVARSRLYVALAAGELTARRHGRRTVIEAAELQRWIASWPVATFSKQAA